MSSPISVTNKINSRIREVSRSQEESARGINISPSQLFSPKISEGTENYSIFRGSSRVQNSEAANSEVTEKEPIDLDFNQIKLVNNLEERANNLKERLKQIYKK